MYMSVYVPIQIHLIKMKNAMRFYMMYIRLDISKLL